MASFTVCYYHRKLSNQLFIWEEKKTRNFQNSLLLWFTEKYELVIDHLFCALHNMTMIDFEVFYISAKSLKSFYFCWILMLFELCSKGQVLLFTYPFQKWNVDVLLHTKTTWNSVFTDYQIRCSWFQWNLSWVPIFSQVSQYLPCQAYRVLWNLMI